MLPQLLIKLHEVWLPRRSDHEFNEQPRADQGRVLRWFDSRAGGAAETIRDCSNCYRPKKLHYHLNGTCRRNGRMYVEATEDEQRLIDARKRSWVWLKWLMPARGGGLVIPPNIFGLKPFAESRACLYRF